MIEGECATLIQSAFDIMRIKNMDNAMNEDIAQFFEENYAVEIEELNTFYAEMMKGEVPDYETCFYVFLAGFQLGASYRSITNDLSDLERG